MANECGGNYGQIGGIIASVGQLGLGVYDRIASGVQRRKAQKFFDKNKYEVPSGVRSMLDVVRGVASQRQMPGYENYMQQIQGTTSQGVETARRTGQSTSDVLGSLQGLYSKQMNAQQDLAIQNAQNWQKNQMQYANSLNTLGQYETEKWNYNVLYPYMQQMTGAGQLAQAGNENIASGISSGLDILSANQQMQTDEDNHAKWKAQRGY